MKKRAIGRLIEAKGEVQLKRQNWPDYQPTTEGAELYSGDLLKPAPSAKARIQYADGQTTWPVPAGEVSGVNQGCPPESSFISESSDKTIGMRVGDAALSIPYIISPRQTLLLNPRPIIRWNKVDGAEGYAVSLVDDEGELLWEVEVEETEITYPEDKPSLELGVDYLLIVETETGKSSEEEKIPNRGFKLLDSEKTGLVQEALEQLTAQDLTEEGESLARAYLYKDYGLRAEAIETLENLAKKGSHLTGVYRTLGDLYWQVGLNQWAELRYLRAFDLAKAIGDLEGQGLAALGLGKTYDNLGNEEEALNWLAKATDKYSNLGEMETVKGLEELAAEISS